MTGVMVEVRLGKEELEREIERVKQHGIGLEKAKERRGPERVKRYRIRDGAYRISTFESTLMDFIDFLDEKIGQRFVAARSVRDIPALMRNVEGNIRAIAGISTSGECVGCANPTLMKSIEETIGLVTGITTLVDRASKKGSFYNVVRSYLLGTDDYYKKYGSGRYNEVTTFLRSVLPFEVYWKLKRPNRTKEIDAYMREILILAYMKRVAQI